MLEAESSSFDSSEEDSFSDATSSNSDSSSDLSDVSRDRHARRCSPSPPRPPRRDSPRRGRGDSRTPSPPPRSRRDEPCRRHNNSRTPSPHRSRRHAVDHLVPVEIHPTVGEVTAGHYLHHLVPVETSDAITVAPHTSPHPSRRDEPPCRGRDDSRTPSRRSRRDSPHRG